jgi:alkanesulfonate monooxygenase SsuD/methylene tetrahydromethanopterin reductase-like flavin-dependent oxidoreductase (luciferase family)
MNATIDAAAESAGRSPRDIRRMYNMSGSFGRSTGLLQGQPREWAEQLAEITLNHGISTYVLPVASTGELERFAQEVAPAVRELVDAARAGQSTTESNQRDGDGGPVA